MSIPKSFSVIAGNYYDCDGNVGRVMSFIDHDTVLIKLENIKECIRYKTYELAPVKKLRSSTTPKNYLDLTSREEAICDFRFRAVKDLVEASSRQGNLERVTARAAELNVSIPTIYRWMNKLKSGRSKTSLLNKGRSDVGKSRLSKRADELIEDVIENHYRTLERPTFTSSYSQLQIKCREEGVVTPHKSTFVARVRKLPENQTMGYRYGHKAKREFYSPSPKGYQEALRPLSIVQIDHTKVDIMCRDEEYGREIGRPWITVAIDIFSRMVVGYFISFDPPNTGSVAQCIYHAVQPKENWLNSMGIDAKWPIHGLIESIHCDNAREFRGNSLKNACEHYNMNLFFRPVGKPEYGAHIERLMGTLANSIHSIPGTTFSNIKEKGNYKSSEKATLTISHLQKHCAIFFSKIYHNTAHEGLGDNLCPLVKYEDAAIDLHSGVPASVAEIISDEHSFKLDFMPMAERSIQKDGVSWDNITYYSEVLAPFIKFRNSEFGKESKKFVFRRDPWDISKLYFKSPETGQYSEILCKDGRMPPMSLWEFRVVKKFLKDKNFSRINLSEIIDGHKELSELVIEARNSKKLKNSTKKFMRKPGHHDPMGTTKPQKKTPQNRRALPINPDEIKIFPSED